MYDDERIMDYPFDNISEEITDELKIGEKIKKLREEKDISLQFLSEKTGFSMAILSQIETHLISPPLGVLLKLARALEVEMGYFFEEMRESEYTVVRKDERKDISRVASKEGVRYGYTYQSLAYDKKGRHMEPFLVTLEPATVKNQHPYSHEGEEFLFVLEGKMEVTIGDKTKKLEPGDCIYYDSSIPHKVQCYENNETKILAVIYTGGKTS